MRVRVYECVNQYKVGNGSMVSFWILVVVVLLLSSLVLVDIVVVITFIVLVFCGADLNWTFS